MILEMNGNLAFANRQARKLLGLTLQDAGRPFADLEVSCLHPDLRPLIDAHGRGKEECLISASPDGLTFR